MSDEDKRGGVGSDLWSDPTQDRDKLVLVREKGDCRRVGDLVTGAERVMDEVGWM